MRAFLPIAVSMLLAASWVRAQDPQLEDRADDLASLAAHLREGAGKVREGYLKALADAKTNRGEIEQAVDSCPTRRERLAMVWLVSGMPGRTFARRTETGWDLEPDLEKIKAEHLLHNVRYAFAARDRFPWCRELPWDLFLGFVLPYRGSQEPLQDYRPALWKEIEPLVRGCKDATEALQAVNRWASGKVKLGKREPQDLGVLEAIEKGTGRSEDLTNFAIAAASTAGVPCAAVYTPWWTRSDGNQAWSEAWVGGRWRSFAGCEPAPEGEFFDRIKEKPCFAKVYRKRFVAKEGEDETFGEDLTADYTPVAGLSLEVERAAAPVQLGVWNSNGWRAVAAAVSGADKKAVFKNVGCRETILFAAFFQDAEAGIAQPPFLFGPGGTVERLTTDLIEPGAAGLQGVKLEALLPNTAYGLAYFTDRQWLLVARGTAKIGGDLDFGVVGREKTLYVLGRIYGERTLPQGRPFLLEFEGGKAIMKKY